ncbi:MAG: GTP-binding protein [Cyanobacteria bacterium J06627_28]
MRRAHKWKPEEQKHSEFVVIGRNLDREEFAEGFLKCLV